MAGGIYIYGEKIETEMEDYTGELVSAAKSLNSEEDITVFTFGRGNVFADDTRAKIIAEYLKNENPFIVLIPATVTAKSLFSRVAVLLDVGMTADCTEIYMEDGVFRQKKPAFGNNTMVVTEEVSVPAMVTIVTGIYPKAKHGDIVILEDAEESKVKLLEVTDQEVESIINAEHILSLGKGVLNGGGWELAQSLSEKLGAAIGGTRPLVDNGMIEFEQQIGQTGFTVHPRTCLFVGVSGAIQHTEGVRDTEVTIAVNNDPDAAIFSYVDYGVVGDAEEIMKAMLQKL